MSPVGITPELKERYGPWECPKYGDAPPTALQSRARTEARYLFLRHWRGATPELMLVATHHPDGELRLWLNALISNELAQSETHNRYEVGLGKKPTEAHPAPAPVKHGWADDYD